MFYCVLQHKDNILLMTEKEDTSKEQEKSAEEKHELTDSAPEEIGGREGLEPTRYGDWEKNGRCIDF